MGYGFLGSQALNRVSMILPLFGIVILCDP